MPEPTYPELLRNKKWQQKRLEVFQRDNWTCCNPNCDNDEHQFLHVHHRRYITGHKPWEYDLEDFETLCENCHREKHGIIDVAKYQLAFDDKGKLVYYDLPMLKQLGFSLIGYLEEGECFYRYQGHFILIHLSTNQRFRLFATKGLKANIERLEQFYTKQGYVYYKVPQDTVAFYEAVYTEDEELTIIAGQSHKSLALQEFHE